MPERVRNPQKLAALLAQNAPEGLIDDTFNASDWLTDPRNIALRIDDDLAMFEHLGPGIVQGHVWFASRGSQAIERGKMMLATMFNDYGINTIKGETPVQCEGALLFIAKLGFKPVGEALRPQGRVIVSAASANLFHERLVA